MDNHSRACTIWNPGSTCHGFHHHLRCVGDWKSRPPIPSLLISCYDASGKSEAVRMASYSSLLHVHDVRRASNTWVAPAPAEHLQNTCRASGEQGVAQDWGPLATRWPSPMLPTWDLTRRQSLLLQSCPLLSFFALPSLN